MSRVQAARALLSALGPALRPGHRPVLADPELDRSLRLDGFVVTSLVSEASARSLRSAYCDDHGVAQKRLFDHQPPDFEGDFWSSDIAYRERVAERILSATRPAVDRAFESHDQPAAATYLVKWPSGPAPAAWDGVPDRYHNDTMYVDERTGDRSVMLWVALQAISSANGALWVVPGSHLLPRSIRGLDLEPPWLRHQSVLADHAVQLTMKPGEAVIFDPALVHCSGPNRTSTPRIVAGVLLTEPGTKLTYFRRRSESLAEQVVVEEDFMTTALVDDLPHYRADAIVEYRTRDLSEKALARSLNTIARLRRLPRRPIRSLTGSKPGGDRARPVLRDPEADRQLHELGFVVTSPMPWPVVSDALCIHRELRGTSGEGFEADLTNPDVEYRNNVCSVLDSIFGDAVRNRFSGHQPFLWNFLCKWPGDTEPLYLHRDWMFVDEPAGCRSYLVWIPLQDIHGENGRLRVLPGSHKIDGELSGTGLQPSWIEFESLIRDRMIEVSVRAGDVVVMDHALVHCSDPNRTDKPRVVAACAVRSPSDPLVHYRREDDFTATRYEVEEAFFTTFTPEQLINAPPPIEPSSTRPAPTHNLSQFELSRLLEDAAAGPSGTCSPNPLEP